MYVALYRRNSALNDWPILEVVGVSAVTAAISYLVRARRVVLDCVELTYGICGIDRVCTVSLLIRVVCVGWMTDIFW